MDQNKKVSTSLKLDASNSSIAIEISCKMYSYTEFSPPPPQIALINCETCTLFGQGFFIYTASMHFKYLRTILILSWIY